MPHSPSPEPHIRRSHMRRLTITLILLTAATLVSAQDKAAPRKAVAAPQTARQALIEMLIPKILVRMKQEGNDWRLAEIGFVAKLQLDDGEKLDELQNSIMSGMSALQQVKQQPKPAPRTKD